MTCEDCRDVVSARLDGEDLPGEASTADWHLAGCAGCRRYAEDAARVTRLLRTRPVEPVPDLGAAVLPPARPRVPWVRLGLGAVGVAQAALAVAAVTAAGGAHGGLAGASAAHLAHESAAWELALAVGFLWAATSRRRPSGLLPLVAAFVGLLAVLSVLDVVSGAVAPARLLTHVLVVAGLVLLALQNRVDRGGGRDREQPRPGPASRSVARLLSVRARSSHVASARERAA